jgi:hypothetical protein
VAEVIAGAVRRSGDTLYVHYKWQQIIIGALRCYGQQDHDFRDTCVLIFAVVNKKTDQPCNCFDFQLI